ncbi:Cu+-exporting ATPase [Bifidobacterium commune]|uniref:Cu+-exporting ATPase n=1 Tax=Bifidobacterium commune TaxID=1505727 RepID=A0A1C4GZI4_9BIFI|nr:heavy metal translocating P-type ATPase [Bifidobacterium commune]MBB2955251.1 Cu+-exporting ATPase [Bifidobacterium commune]SCC78074.1 Cu+-exporting ATPase [Bifidobacterium commune]
MKTQVNGQTMFNTDANGLQGRSGTDPDAERKREIKVLNRRLVIAAALTLPILVFAMFGMWLAVFVPMGVVDCFTNPWVQFVFITPVMFYSGWPIHRTGWLALVHRSPEMNSLVALGTAASYAYSVVVTVMPGLLPSGAREPYFESVGTIITLMLLGQLLEAHARLGTGESIRALIDLTPKTAHVVRDGNTLDIDADRVEVGDVVLIKPGEQLPVDGTVISGRTTVDESMITGEPIPATKAEGDTVTGGTVNGNGTLQYRATKVGRDTVLSQIIELVRTAQTSKAPIQKLADRISGYFVPGVMLIAIWTFVVWWIFGPAPRGLYGLVAAVAVLVIACPCALGIATPLSVTISTGKAARYGVLIRSAEALETTREIDTVVLDKTGTITRGKPELTGVSLVNDVLGDGGEDALLSLAAGAEQASEHPLAQAVVEGAQRRGLTVPQPDSFEAAPGSGIVAHVEGHEVVVGNGDLMKNCGVDVQSTSSVCKAVAQSEADATQVFADYAQQGKTPMFAAVDGQLAAVLAVADTLKSDSAEAVTALRERGLQVIMLTGDNATTAEAIANAVGVDHVIAGVHPEHKAKEIARLQNEGHMVAMVGDGINDAPALAAADVGFAMGTGTDVAIQSSDITLVSGSLSGLVTAIDLSRAAMRNIKQNLGFAFGYNGIGIPVAAGILYPIWHIMLSPMIAGAAMAFSSLSVVLNANRLRSFDPNKIKPRKFAFKLHERHVELAVAPTKSVDASADAPHDVPEQHMKKKEGSAMDMNMNASANTVKDPVCGMMIDPKTAAASQDYNGKTYYFCSDNCAKSFAADPAKYAD